MTLQDMSQHAQTCFNPLIAFFPALVDKLLNAPRTKGEGGKEYPTYNTKKEG